MKIILVAGKARNGKDSISDFIEEEYTKRGLKVCRMMFGEYIKFYAKKYFGWDGNEETKPRELLQQLGIEVIRNKIDPLFHVNRFIQDIEVLSNFFDVAIAADVREPNEMLKACKKYDNITTIHIERPGINELTSKQSSHYTETALDGFDSYDYKIINDGSLEDLKKKAIDIVDKEVMKDGKDK